LALFGVFWLVAFSALGWTVWRNTHSTGAAGAIGTLAVAVPAAGWIAPAWMRIVYLATAYAAFPAGLVISHVMLALVYYAVLTPIGLVLRLFRFDPMRRRFDSQAKTYWIGRETRRDVKSYFRQF
jgi:hypothetical protein